jgi:hypothetical protein
LIFAADSLYAFSIFILMTPLLSRFSPPLARAARARPCGALPLISPPRCLPLARHAAARYATPCRCRRFHAPRKVQLQRRAAMAFAACFSPPPCRWRHDASAAAPLRRCHAMSFFISPLFFSFRRRHFIFAMPPGFIMFRHAAAFSPAIRHAEPPMPLPPFIFAIHAMPPRGSASAVRADGRAMRAAQRGVIARAARSNRGHAPLMPQPPCSARRSAACVQK